MTYRLLFKLAKETLAKQKQIYIPYLLAISVMMAMQYIMMSLINNAYIQSKRAEVTTLVVMAVFFSGILSVIFILYANQFIFKQRCKEFALYQVLGMEKKHIGRLILFENLMASLITSVTAICLGYGLGHLLFMALNRLMRDTGATVMDYPFDSWAALLTFAVIVVVFLFLTLLNRWFLSRVQVADLMHTANAGEGEPKSRWIILVVGVVTLLAGYYLALVTEGFMSSLLIFFIAIFLVMFATFALMVSLSIIILKASKAKKNYYYDAKHFFSISGLLARMKSNAVSLAGLAVLCTGIILTFGTTLTLYLGMDHQVQRSMARDYSIKFVDRGADASTSLPDQQDKVAEQLLASKDLNDLIKGQSLFLTMLNQDGALIPLDQGTSTPNNYSYVVVELVDNYNKVHGTDYHLEGHQALFTSSLSRFQNQKQLKLADQTFDLKHLTIDDIPTNLVGNIFYLVVAGPDQLKQIQSVVTDLDLEGKPVKAPIKYSLDFNLGQDQDFNEADLEALQGPETNLVLTKRKDLSQEIYGYYGGFLFLGIVVGIVLFVCITLMLYFKQLSEGLDDRAKYQTMKQVGLSQSLIKQTIHQQVLWIFSLPLVVALIHALVAHKIMFELLSLFAIRNQKLFLLGYGSVFIGFILVYYIIYKLTSSVYYRMINQE